MEKKSLLLFLLSIIGLTYSQNNFEKSNKDIFVNDFPIVEQFPVLFDQISLGNFDEYKFNANKLPCNKVQSFFVDENGRNFFKVTDTIFNRFYSIGRIILPEDSQLLIFALVSNPNGRERDCDVYYSEIDRDMKIITLSSFGSSYASNSIATLLLGNFDYIQMNFGVIEYNSYLYDEIDEKNKLSNNDNLMLYKPSYDEIPISDNLSVKFSREKTMSLQNLIPLNFCSPFISQPITKKINNDKIDAYSSYFLGAKKIDENRKIIFVLNNLQFNNYFDVREINYMIINKDGIVKVDNFSLFYTDKQGRNYDTVGNIQDLKDRIILTSLFLKNQKIIEIIK
jgi:hypothetical protein